MTDNDTSDRRTVEILGEVLPVKTSDDGDGSHRAVALVEDKIETIRERSPEANRLQIALLSCLNLAGQLVKLEDASEAAELSDGTLERLRHLESRLDTILEEE